MPVWLDQPYSLFARMESSFSLYDPITGFHPEVLARVAGEPMRNTLAMFCSALSPGGVDLAGQGTLDVSVGPVLGALLLAGLLLTFADGWGTAVLPVVWFTVMLLGCGVFAQATPWYTRLVPATAVTALLMARALDGLVGLVPATGPWRRLAAAATATALLFSVTVPNVRRYVGYEEGFPPSIFTLFRLEADKLPAGTRFVCVTFERSDFTCRHPCLGPFVARPSTEDVADPLDILPVPPGKRTAFLVPFERFIPNARDPELLVGEILRFHPDARVLRTGPLRDGRPLGTVVVVEPGNLRPSRIAGQP